MSDSKSESFIDLKSGPTLGYFVIRWALGINLLIHGSVRIFGDYAGFVQWVIKTFEGTALPISLVRLYGQFIPLFELTIGFLLIFGLFTQLSLFLGGLFMSTLIFGMGLKQNWSTLADQMIYVLVFYLLLEKIRYNLWSLDYLWESNSE